MSRLEFLEKFLTNNFALSDDEDNTSGLLNREDIADLALVRIFLAICAKSLDTSDLLGYEIFAASRTLLQQLLDCLNFNLRFRRFILLMQMKKVISMNYDKQHKQLKTMQMSEASPNF